MSHVVSNGRFPLLGVVRSIPCARERARTSGT
jgi:hypothetical protein